MLSETPAQTGKMLITNLPLFHLRTHCQEIGISFGPRLYFSYGNTFNDFILCTRYYFGYSY